jgi:hypothetical protein
MLALACSVNTTTSFDPEGGAGSGGAAAGGTGGFPPGSENCENGTDDDSDGQVDCADDDCATYACSPTIPAGWEGPVAFYLGPEAPPECDQSGGFTQKRSDGGTLDVSPYTCPACACDPAGVVCTPTVISYADENCSGAQLPKTGVGCVGFDSPDDQNSIRLQFNGPAGACSPSSGPTLIPPPSYPQQARICGLPTGLVPGGGCSGEACIPRPATPFSLCVHRPDAAPCPTAFPVVHTIVTGFQDTRGCSACNCPTNCTATAVAYDFCGDPEVLASANQPNQCVNLSSSQQNLDVVMTGTVVCSPSGGQPAGTVTTTEVTLCCVT